jgi:EmrB/QacA subfamily drug resistance transporter
MRDMPPAEGAPAGWRGTDPRQRRVLGSTLSANALVFFEQTAVILALPAIRRDFGARASDLHWVVTAYLLAMAVFMLVAGRFADHVGRRKTFLAGLVIFAAGSMLCAVAPGLSWLIAFRFLQGIGGAIVQPLALEVTTRAVRADQRGWAIGALATGGTSFLVFGPLIAGVLLTANWRWIFIVALPVVALSFMLGYHAIAPSRAETRRPISLQSIALLLIGLGALVFGLVSGEQLGIHAVVAILAGLCVLGLFVRSQLRAPDPLIELHLLRHPMLATCLAAIFAIQFAVLGVMFYLALYLQHRLGLTGVAAGAVIAVAGIGTPLLSMSAGRVADRRGPRWLVLPGLMLATVALLALGVLVPIGGALILLPGLTLFAVARPAVFTPAGIGPFLVFSGQQRAFASSLVTESRQLGAVMGVAFTTAVGIAVHGGSLTEHDPALGRGFRAAALVAAIVCALAAVVTWRWMPMQKQQAGSLGGQPPRRADRRRVVCHGSDGYLQLVTAQAPSYNLPSARSPCIPTRGLKTSCGARTSSGEFAATGQTGCALTRLCRCPDADRATSTPMASSSRRRA